MLYNTALHSLSQANGQERVPQYQRLKDGKAFLVQTQTPLSIPHLVGNLSEFQVEHFGLWTKSSNQAENVHKR